MWPAIKAGRRRLLSGIGVAALTALTGVALQHRPPQLYRLGLAAPFEGLFRSSGYGALAAARELVEPWNERLRPYGAQLQLWAVDDGNDPDTAVLRARELAADPLTIAVVGHLAPETSSAAAELYGPAGLLQLSPVPLIPAGPGRTPGTTLSVGIPPSRLAEFMAAHTARTAECPTPTNGKVQFGLLDLALRLASGAGGPAEVCLELGYCPDALPLTFPEVAFSTVVSEATPSLQALVSAATAGALDAILSAASRGRLTREEIAAAALDDAQLKGWIAEGDVWYPPSVGTLSLVGCPAGRQP